MRDANVFSADGPSRGLQKIQQLQHYYGPKGRKFFKSAPTYRFLFDRQACAAAVSG
jgi:hypothetical protein